MSPALTSVGCRVAFANEATMHSRLCNWDLVHVPERLGTRYCVPVRPV